MGNYGIRRRRTRVNGRIHSTSTGGVRRTSAVAQLDEIMSYRTRSGRSEETVTPQKADPYGYFLNGVAARRHRNAVLQGSFGSEKPRDVDEGHPFWVNHRSVVTSARLNNYRYYNGTTSATLCYGGPAWATTASLTDASAATAIFRPQSNTNQVGFGIPVPTSGELAAFGQHAIGVLAPARSEVNIFGMIAEFLQGIPRLPFSSLEKWDGIARNGADEFLNYIFGIQPTVGDISKLVGVLTNVSRRLDQLQRDAGRGVRREWTLPMDQRSQEFSGTQLQSQGDIRYQPDWQDSTNTRDFQSQGPSIVASQYQGNVQSSVLLSQKESFRFDGSFTYYLPLPKGWDGSWRHYATLADKLVSGRPTTQVLWNLIPFSWLVDWLVDISQILRTAEVAADDSLVVNWAYASRLLERTVIQQSRYTSSPVGRVPQLKEVSTVYKLVRKERLRGNPYGFSLPTSADWTPIRFAILGALGISRAPRF